MSEMALHPCRKVFRTLRLHCDAGVESDLEGADLLWPAIIIDDGVCAAMIRNMTAVIVAKAGQWPGATGPRQAS